MRFARKRKIKDDCKAFGPSYWKNGVVIPEMGRFAREKNFFVSFYFISITGGGNYWRQVEMLSRQSDIQNSRHIPNWRFKFESCQHIDNI